MPTFVEEGASARGKPHPLNGWTAGVCPGVALSATLPRRPGGRSGWSRILVLASSSWIWASGSGSWIRHALQAPRSGARSKLQNRVPADSKDLAGMIRLLAMVRS
jgi:hypothetical protein